MVTGRIGQSCARAGDANKTIRIAHEILRRIPHS
jgi:hypothetical protein